MVQTLTNHVALSGREAQLVLVSLVQGVAIPRCLHEARIRMRWRREQQLRKTLANRPDLLEHAALSDEDRRILFLIASEMAKTP